jgi:hypothetical protein
MDIASSLPKLLKTIEDKGQNATKSANDERSQEELLYAARELVSALESPIERLCRMVYLEVSKELIITGAWLTTSSLQSWELCVHR